MARDTMRMLLAVRRHAVEEARAGLSACLRSEAAAADRLRAIDEAAERDRVASRSVAEAHRFIDMFALNVQANAAGRQAAEAALSVASEAAGEARIVLVAARTAAESIQTLINERAAAAAAEADRREQHALDDMARARFDSG
jgi:flagellar biosynthesis chaperone FliJ